MQIVYAHNIQGKSILSYFIVEIHPDYLNLYDKGPALVLNIFKIALSLFLFLISELSDSFSCIALFLIN